MRVIDVDSHFHEPKDWLSQIDPKLAAELPPSITFPDLTHLMALGEQAQLPESLRPEDAKELEDPMVAKVFEIVAGLQPESSEPGNGDYDAEARVRLCDANGIDMQFLNPTYVLPQLAQMLMIGRPDLTPRLMSIWNRWAAERVHGYSDRLMPVTQTDFSDVDAAIEEMTRMREAGSRAFSLGTLPPAPDKSVSHPDFEPVWSAAEDLGMVLYLHIGGNRERINSGWAGNGGNHRTFRVLNGSFGNQGPRLALGAMVLDGVFERHPRLGVVIAEYGFDWVEAFGVSMDHWVDGTRSRGKTFEKPWYEWSLKPSEFLRRQVRVTPLPEIDPVDPTFFDSEMSEMAAFSSDFPHPEGRLDAFEYTRKRLDGVAPDALERYFGGGMAPLLGL